MPLESSFRLLSPLVIRPLLHSAKSKTPHFREHYFMFKYWFTKIISWFQINIIIFIKKRTHWKSTLLLFNFFVATCYTGQQTVKWGSKCDSTIFSAMFIYKHQPESSPTDDPLQISLDFRVFGLLDRPSIWKQVWIPICSSEANTTRFWLSWSCYMFKFVGFEELHLYTWPPLYMTLSCDTWIITLKLQSPGPHYFPPSF